MRVMAGPSSLPDLLSTEPKRINVVLFSQVDCEFCAEERENYLKPLAALRRRELSVAEVELDGPKKMRDWGGRLVLQGNFAKATGVRFAPTVMFFDAAGKSLADPVVGLSRDFFGVYLEQRISVALRAVS